MWTSTLDLKLNRVLLARLLGLVYPRVYYSSLSPLHVANIPRSALPAANWVRVRNRLAGICESDLHLVHADTDMRSSVAALPHYEHTYPGHEVVGEVIEIGGDVQHLQVGDRVVLQYSPNCLSSGVESVCRACAAGDYNLCEYGILPGPQPIGGGWSEEMLLHEQQLFRLPRELSDEQGVILEPAAIALHTLLRHMPQDNDNVLIIGGGTVGLLTLHILHTLLPKARISMFARYPFQIEHATRLGADHIIYPMNPYVSVQRATHAVVSNGGILSNRTLIGGYDVIYDAVGQQKTLHHALRWLRAQGTMVMAGVSPHMMHIDLSPIWHQEINLLGSLSHGRETWPQGPLTDLLGTPADLSTFSLVTALIQRKHIQPEKLITHRFALNKYQDALIAAKNIKSSQSVKVLFDYALLPTSVVPNVHSAAHPALSGSQGNAFMEEFLKTQGITDHHEAIPQSSRAQRALPAKILDTPPPQGFIREAWPTTPIRQDDDQDDADEDTDPAIPAIKRLPYNPRASARVPVTPLPMEPAPTLSVETDESETNSISAQPVPEATRVASTSADLGQAQGTVPTLEMDVPVEMEGPVEVEGPVEMEGPAHEEELITSFPETTGMNVLTEEQLPTQTVLDHLFDTDTSSMPAFLAQLSEFDTQAIPEIPGEHAEVAGLSDISAATLPIEDAEAPILSDVSSTVLPAEGAEAPVLSDVSSTVLPAKDAEAAVLPDTTDTTALIDSSDQAREEKSTEPAVSKPKEKKKRKNSATSKRDDQLEERQIAEKSGEEAHTEQIVIQTTQEQITAD